MSSSVWTLVSLAIAASAIILANTTSSRRVTWMVLGAVTLALLGQITGIYPLSAALNAVDLRVVVIVFALEVLSTAAMGSGILERVAAHLLSWVRSPLLLYAGLVVLTFVLSCFLNNLAALAVLCPILFTVSEAAGLQTQSLVPVLVVASNIGGATTKIGDFPNILISQTITASFGDFFVNLGLPLLVIALPAILAFGSLAVVPRADRRKAPTERMRFLLASRLLALTIDRPVLVSEAASSLGAFTLFIGSAALLPNGDLALFALLALGVLCLTKRGIDTSLVATPVATVAFFVSLYMIVGAVMAGDLLPIVSRWLLATSQVTSSSLLAILFMGSVATITAFLSAGPTTAVLLGLTHQLSAVFPGYLAYWCLSLGVLAGSSALLGSATAGPIAASIYQRVTGRRMPGMTYALSSLPMAAILLAIAIIYVAIRLGT